MSEQQDVAAAAAETMGRLLGPGGPAELRVEPVLGTELPVFVHRARALHEVLAASVEHGDRTYIATAESRLSFAEHAARVSSIAHALRTEHGVARGDRIAIAAANEPAWIEAFWATVSIGAIAVGFNAWWSPGELAYGVQHSTPTLIVADAKRAITLSDAGVEVQVLSLETDLERLATAYPDAPLPSADVAEDDPAVILYTSGTSGRPKGATHSHRNLCSVIEYHRLNDRVAAAFGDPTDPRDKAYLLAMPLFHIGSLHNLAVPRLATGSKVVMHRGGFDVDRVLALVQQERVTHWGAVPTMANRLLEHPELGNYDTSSLYAFALASAPSSVSFKERLKEKLPFAFALADSYGLTETCTAVAVATPVDLAASPGTLGRPIAGVQMEVRSFDGTVLPPGEEGEVCVRSAYNMLGYWGDDEATARAIGPDRWLSTGDIGSMDDQGRVRLASRRSDLIIRGGENVYPAEVEGILVEHPEVRECLVLGVAHDDLGQEVAAVVVPRDASADATDLEQRLREYAASELAYFKVPTHWRVTTEPLPRNATGKVLRTKVRP